MGVGILGPTLGKVFVRLRNSICGRVFGQLAEEQRGERVRYRPVVFHRNAGGSGGLLGRAERAGSAFVRLVDDGFQSYSEAPLLCLSSSLDARFDQARSEER